MTASRSLFALSILTSVAITPSFALADDWLAVWPACSIADASRPSLSLLYPAPGLPAVVHAGDTLTVRIRTPAALTPPPGVQQEDVLERWTGELTGAALHAGVDARERHRHVLRVSSLRPDGGDSLVYRIRIELPAYLAPGTYDFALRTPFGTRSTGQGVRVLAPGGTPRIARLPSVMFLPPPAAGTWPIDVWLAGTHAEAAARDGTLPRSAVHTAVGAKQPAGTLPRSAVHDTAVGAEHPAGALPASAVHDNSVVAEYPAKDHRVAATQSSANQATRVDPRAAESDAPAPRDAARTDSPATHPKPPDAAELAHAATPAPASEASDPAPTLLSEGSSVALRVGRELWVRSGCSDDAAFEREVAAVLVSDGLTRVAFDPARASAPPSAAELAAPLPISFQRDRAEVDNRTSHVTRELSLLLPFAVRASSASGTLAFYPTAEPSARPPSAKLARWNVPAGTLATLELARDVSSAHPPLRLRPRTARSGQPAQVRVLGAGSRAKVAFTLGFARSAYASPDLHTSFPGPLAHPVRAQVFEPDGSGQVVQGHLWVEPHRPPNCAIERPGQPRRPLLTGTCALALAVTALVRSRRSAKKAPPRPVLE